MSSGAQRAKYRRLAGQKPSPANVISMCVAMYRPVDAAEIFARGRGRTRYSWLLVLIVAAMHLVGEQEFVKIAAETGLDPNTIRNAWRRWHDLIPGLWKEQWIEAIRFGAPLYVIDRNNWQRTYGRLFDRLPWLNFLARIERGCSMWADEPISKAMRGW